MLCASSMSTISKLIMLNAYHTRWTWSLHDKINAKIYDATVAITYSSQSDEDERQLEAKHFALNADRANIPPWCNNEQTDERGDFSTLHGNKIRYLFKIKFLIESMLIKLGKLQPTQARDILHLESLIYVCRHLIVRNSYDWLLRCVACCLPYRGSFQRWTGRET